MAEGFDFGKFPASIIKNCSTSDVDRFLNKFIMSLIFVKAGRPEIFTEVCANGLFIFF